MASFAVRQTMTGHIRGLYSVSQAQWQRGGRINRDKKKKAYITRLEITSRISALERFLSRMSARMSFYLSLVSVTFIAARRKKKKKHTQFTAVRKRLATVCAAIGLVAAVAPFMTVQGSLACKHLSTNRALEVFI